MWTYKTDVGTFKISQRADGRFALWIDNELLGSYNTPHQAADDVYMCATGYWPWDQQLIVMEPADLGEWERHRVPG